ncbi:MAG: NAD(P)H-hydrate dehydratase, partial [Oscillospiraceae bacterium]
GRLEKLVPDRSKRIVILCGSGNNGGDGFVIAYSLIGRGYSPVVVLANGLPRTDCAREHFDILTERGGKILDHRALRNGAEAYTEINHADVIVDCIFGTGFHGELPPHILNLIDQTCSRPLRVAVDVPSGVNSDTGEFDQFCFKPHYTFVLAAMKKGLIQPNCADILGKIELVDIFIPEYCYKDGYEAIITDDSFRRPFPPRKKSSHKGSFGRLLNIAGSLCYNGAAALSTSAALRSGVGLCTLAAPISCMKIIAASVNTATFIPLPETDEGFAAGNSHEKIADILPKMTAVTIGCGLGNSENTRSLTEFVIKNAECPLLIDADGINSIAANINVLKERKGKTVLTPHPLEFSRISGIPIGEIQRDRLAAAKAFAREYGVTLVLKGANTVIASESGEAYVNTCGNAGLARGGSGDVLTGIIGAMLAQGIEPLRAAVSGVYCHALASDILADRLPPECMLPTDIISVLPEVYRI